MSRTVLPQQLSRFLRLVLYVLRREIPGRRKDPYSEVDWLYLPLKPAKITVDIVEQKVEKPLNERLAFWYLCNSGAGRTIFSGLCHQPPNNSRLHYADNCNEKKLFLLFQPLIPRSPPLQYHYQPHTLPIPEA